jgi:hypothetical protein
MPVPIIEANQFGPVPEHAPLLAVFGRRPDCRNAWRSTSLGVASELSTPFAQGQQHHRDCWFSINAGAEDPPSSPSAGFAREQSRGMAIAALLLPFLRTLVNAGCGFCFGQRVCLLTVALIADCASGQSPALRLWRDQLKGIPERHSISRVFLTTAHPRCIHARHTRSRHRDAAGDSLMRHARLAPG